jgi:hypothetical protein
VVVAIDVKKTALGRRDVWTAARTARRSRRLRAADAAAGRRELKTMIDLEGARLVTSR